MKSIKMCLADYNLYYGQLKVQDLIFSNINTKVNMQDVYKIIACSTNFFAYRNFILKIY